MIISQEKADEISEEFRRITNIDCNATYMQWGESHVPTKLLKDVESGVYVFMRDSTVFKVGKAGTNSQARWNSHHYNLDTSPSTFPSSFSADLERFNSFFPENVRITDISRINIKEWVRANTSRIEFKIQNQETGTALNLLEALVQFYLNPIYEG